jgi:pimeloyl-ACP methyl ester carboxylesterase
LTLTNCDTHDNWPPEAFKPFVDMVAGGGLRDTLNVLLANKAVYRSQEALGPAYERPEKVTDEDIETYLRPLVRNDQRTLDLQRFVTSFDNKHTVSIAPKLRALRAPTLIVWATDDIYFPVKWAYWLAGAIPGAKPPVELEGARLFFPEERARDFNRLLRDHLLNG